MDAETDVLVVGAGPVGLTAAVELHRRGVSVRIVDQLAAALPYAKAVGRPAPHPGDLGGDGTGAAGPGRRGADARPDRLRQRCGGRPAGARRPARRALRLRRVAAVRDRAHPHRLPDRPRGRGGARGRPDLVRAGRLRPSPPGWRAPPGNRPYAPATSLAATARTAPSAEGLGSPSSATRSPSSTCSATSRWTGRCRPAGRCGPCTRPTGRSTTCSCASRCRAAGGTGCRCWSRPTCRPRRRAATTWGTAWRPTGRRRRWATSRRSWTGLPPNPPLRATCAGRRCSASVTASSSATRWGGCSWPGTRPTSIRRPARRA